MVGNEIDAPPAQSGPARLPLTGSAACIRRQAPARSRVCPPCRRDSASNGVASARQPVRAKTTWPVSESARLDAGPSPKGADGPQRAHKAHTRYVVRFVSSRAEKHGLHVRPAARHRYPAKIGQPPEIAALSRHDVNLVIAFLGGSECQPPAIGRKMGARKTSRVPRSGAGPGRPPAAPPKGRPRW